MPSSAVNEDYHWQTLRRSGFGRPDIEPEALFFIINLVADQQTRIAIPGNQIIRDIQLARSRL